VFDNPTLFLPVFLHYSIFFQKIFSLFFAPPEDLAKNLAVDGQKLSYRLISLKNLDLFDEQERILKTIG